jgi:hypothetical protein
MVIAKVFTQIEDPRNPSGRRYTLSSIFTLLVCGLIAGRNSLKTIVDWGRSLPPSELQKYGLPEKVPAVATISNLLRRIAVKSVEKALNLSMPNEVGAHAALDGKVLRGTHQDTVPLVHILSLFVTKHQKVINQLRLEEGDNEISAAIRFLEETDIAGLTITGDAIFAKKKSAKK